MSNHEDNIAYFLAFCIEMYSRDLHISGKESSALLANMGALDYLAKHFEAIHTQSPQEILDNIKQFVNTHRS